MVRAVKQVSKYLTKSLRKAGVANEDLATVVAKEVTTAAVGAVDETGLTSDQIEAAIEALVAGVMNGLSDYGADSTTIAETADDVAAGAADGLLDAGISADDANTYITTITDAVSTGSKEAGLTDSEVSAIEQDVEDAVSDAINSGGNTDIGDGGTDTSGPSVSSITVSPESVDITNSSQSVTASVEVADVSGVDLNDLPQPYWYQVDDIQGTRINGTWTLDSGDIYNGTYTTSVTLPVDSKPGQWLIGCIAFKDILGYSSTNGGYSQTFTVVSEP